MEVTNSKEIFDQVSIRCSRLTTRRYSTSFSLGIRFLDSSLRDPIYSIYAFVRLADEIVDSFHDFDQPTLLDRFEHDTYLAIKEGISVNPVLNSFQKTVREYQIDLTLINTFLESMRMDLTIKSYDSQQVATYIHGSAEVVGLMCLQVFVEGDRKLYNELKENAIMLGSAFQKINFLRDINADYKGLGRTYFPDLDLNNFNESTKLKIEQDILIEFNKAYDGIKRLPSKARFGVYLAYIYYVQLFKKIKKTPSQDILQKRIRIRNRSKLTLLFYSMLVHRLNLM